MSLLHKWLLLFLFRLLSVFLITSWFVPDEIYQSVEVAHRLVYGTGHLSWEWAVGLRSYLHPALLALIYKLISLVSLDSSHIVVFQAPRIASALLFSFGDIFFYRLCLRLCPSPRQAHYSFLNYLFAWFPFYCAPRTLANSLETALTLIALHWYPFPSSHSFSRPVFPYIALGLLTIVLRPTAGLLWLIFGLAHLAYASRPFHLLFYTVLPTCLCLLFCTTVLDFYFYGRATFPLWNFLQFNVLSGNSALFGVHPWHWYFTAGLPSVLTLQLLPIVYGLLPFTSASVRPSILPAAASLFFILFHSLLPHKEQRFLLPVLPLLCLYSGLFYARPSRLKQWLFYMTVLVNVCIAVFTGLCHQVGPYAVMDSVISRAHSLPLSARPVRLLSLMPCYSLPGFSYAHTSLDDIVQLQCGPHTDTVMDADKFFTAPVDWLREHSTLIDTFSFIVLYEHLWTGALGNGTLLSPSQFPFSPCDRLFHSYFLTSSREDHYALVLCHK